MKERFNAKRNNQQAGEQLTEVKINAPEARFQDSQQVQSAVKSGSNDAPDTSLIPKKVKSSGHTLRQEVAAEVVTGKSGAVGGVNSPSSYGLREMTFSGDAGTILGNASGTPVLRESIQGKTRFDKKISDANKDINYNASEQVHVEYDMIAPLANNDSTVGFNGNPKNAAVRSQKNTGLTPAEELYDRSLDFVTQDMAVFTSGQRVEQNNVHDYLYPTKTTKFTDEGAILLDQNFKPNHGPISGNYMPDFITVGVSKDDNGTAFISNFMVSEHDISCRGESSATVNVASSNLQIDRNIAELHRQTIDATSGSPTSPHFNPLGRSVSEPSATVAYLRDIETSTGATVFAAYKFAQKARGHYLNRTAKDGQTLIDPAIDALYGGLTSAQSMAELTDLLGESRANAPLIFDDALRHGSAALMLAMFDSVTKYKTKADVINQPRGLKMHLQTADNNMDPFRCKKEFVAALNSVDAYSTIDHDYDPMSPVFIADNFKLIYPYSWSRALQFTRTAPGKREYESEAFTYYFQAGAGQNAYSVTVGEPVLNGVAYFLDMHASSLADALKVAKGGTVTMHIPVVHSTTHFSLWDFIVCASTPYIIYERTNSLKDILDYEQFNEYPFPELVSIKQANPMNAVNYGNPSALEPLQVKTMLPSSAIRWKYPEMLYPLGADAYMLPYYFNERDVEWDDEYTKDAAISIEACENFSTPIIRSGVKLSGLDSFFDMETKDQLLNLDVMVRMPAVKNGAKVKGGVYKYAQGSDGIPFIFATDDTIGEATVVDYMATPRQLGWFMTLPGGVASVKRDADGDAQFCPFSDFAENMFDAGPSYKAIMYKGGLTPTSTPENILGNASVNVSRAQAFVQNWHSRFATRDGSSQANFDLMLSPLDGFDSDDNGGSDVSISARAGYTMFRPLTVGKYSATADNRADELGNDADLYPRLFSIMRIYWAVMQKLPFIINPFAAYADSDSFIEGYVDPFDLAYLFGLSGFAAANYYEEVFNRANQVLNQGYGYTKDPMVSDSPVFKDAFKYTEI